MPPSALALGSVLQGEFSLEEKLGGQVYRARRTRDGRELAVRVAYPVTPELAADFMALAEGASRVRHPTLASVEAFGRLEDGGCYIATELVRGQSLFGWADQIGIPPLAQVVELVRRLTIGLQAAARAGVVHDALNPRNVRVLGAAKNTGTRTPLKLLDLGVPALLFDHTRDPQALRFMAPEQLGVLAQPEPPLTFRCSATMNVYSCGSLLYYLATGGPPHAGLTVAELLASQAGGRLTPPVRINPQISAGLNAVVVRALAIDPSERFVSVAELGEALASVSSSVSLHMRTSLTPPPGPLPRPLDAELEEEPPTFKTPRGLIPALEQSALATVELRSDDHLVEDGGALHDKPTLPPTAPPPPEMGEMGDSVSGVAPIGLFSSSPPLLERHSSLPPEVTPGSSPKATPLAAFSEPPLAARARHTDRPDSGRLSSPTITSVPPAFPANDGNFASSPRLSRPGSVPPPSFSRRPLLWVALPSAAAACLVAFFTVRSLIGEGAAPQAALPSPAESQRPLLVEPVAPAREAAQAPGAVIAVPPSPSVEPARVEPEVQPESQLAPAPSSSGSRREREREKERERERERDHAHHGRSSNRASGGAVTAVDKAQEAQKTAHEQELAKTADGTPAPGMPEPIDIDLDLSVRPKPSPSAAPEARAPTPSERPVVAVAPVPVQPSSKREPVLPLTAKVQVSGLEVHGSLPTSNVKRRLNNLAPQFKSCYERSAQAAGHNGFGELIVDVQIDERGRARSPHVRGAGLPRLEACVADVVSKLNSERPPDTGTVVATWKISFTP